MKPQALLGAWTAGSGLVSPSLASPTTTTSAALPAFTYNADSFLLHGEPHVLIGGQMDPQRIPPAYWRDRLRKARAMGLNTIFSYVYWNLLEPQQGQWTAPPPNTTTADDTAVTSNDISRYLALAQDEGLHVVLRPGPYICGERDWGGLPAWLASVPGMVVRSDNAPFLDAAGSYLARLAEDLAPWQVTRGGPLLMVQVENEYGSYGADHGYTAKVRDMLSGLFDVPLYTNDGGVDWTLAGGSVPGVLAEIDGDPTSGFLARDTYITDPSMLGPLLDGEYYTYGPDTWGPTSAHATLDDSAIAKITADVEYVLSANNSISLYMFHGGTNFALTSGSLWKNYTLPFTTSYDYAAPLSEDGRTTPLYTALRSTIQKYIPAGKSIPDPPAEVPRLSIAEDIILSPRAWSLFDEPPSTNKTLSEAPLTMEALGQADGLVLYAHTVAEAVQGVFRPGDRARDRVLVYVNGVRSGVIDSIYAQPQTVTLDLQPNDTLHLLVENLGRVDYYSLESDTANHVLDPYKGIVGNVTVGNSTPLSGWTMTSLPFDTLPSSALTPSDSNSNNTSTQGAPPAIFAGTFALDAAGNYTDPAARDTFLEVRNGTKGVVWVNGVNLGRYWVVGPQQLLYVPGTVVRDAGKVNEVVVLELEPGNGTLVARCEAERVWGNNADPDYVL